MSRINGKKTHTHTHTHTLGENYCSLRALYLVPGCIKSGPQGKKWSHDFELDEETNYFALNFHGSFGMSCFFSRRSESLDISTSSKKSLHASRLSKHPPVRWGGNVKKFRWDHRLQIQNLRLLINSVEIDPCFFVMIRFNSIRRVLTECQWLITCPTYHGTGGTVFS